MCIELLQRSTTTLNTSCLALGRTWEEEEKTQWYFLSQNGRSVHQEKQQLDVIKFTIAIGTAITITITITISMTVTIATTAAIAITVTITITFVTVITITIALAIAIAIAIIILVEKILMLLLPLLSYSVLKLDHLLPFLFLHQGRLVVHVDVWDSDYFDRDDRIDTFNLDQQVVPISGASNITWTADVTLGKASPATMKLRLGEFANVVLNQIVRLFRSTTCLKARKTCTDADSNSSA